MSSDPSDDHSTPSDVRCPKCGSPSKLVATLRKLAADPDYSVFQCGACDFVQWIPEL
jgi:DNA-directed RNA polymerase subunit M/transcription elongation factor TFIIS